MRQQKQLRTYDLTVLNRYRGKWVALSPDKGKVVGSGSTPKQAMLQAQKRGIEKPILTGAPLGSGIYILFLGCPS